MQVRGAILSWWRLFSPSLCLLPMRNTETSEFDCGGLILKCRPRARKKIEGKIRRKMRSHILTRKRKKKEKWLERAFIS